VTKKKKFFNVDLRTGFKFGTGAAATGGESKTTGFKFGESTKSDASPANPTGFQFGSSTKSASVDTGFKFGSGKAPESEKSESKSSGDKKEYPKEFLTQLKTLNCDVRHDSKHL